jgi:hypothetical protein
MRQPEVTHCLHYYWLGPSGWFWFPLSRFGITLTRVFLTYYFCNKPFWVRPYIVMSLLFQGPEVSNPGLCPGVTGSNFGLSVCHFDRSYL